MDRGQRLEGAPPRQPGISRHGSLPLLPLQLWGPIVHTLIMWLGTPALSKICMALGWFHDGAECASALAWRFGFQVRGRPGVWALSH